MQGLMWNSSRGIQSLATGPIPVHAAMRMGCGVAGVCSSAPVQKPHIIAGNGGGIERSSSSSCWNFVGDDGGRGDDGGQLGEDGAPAAQACAGSTQPRPATYDLSPGKALGDGFTKEPERGESAAAREDEGGGDTSVTREGTPRALIGRLRLALRTGEAGFVRPPGISRRTTCEIEGDRGELSGAQWSSVELSGAQRSSGELRGAQGRGSGRTGGYRASRGA